MNDHQLYTAVQAIMSAPSAPTLRALHFAFATPVNPVIELHIGGQYAASFDDDASAKHHFLRGAAVGVTAPCPHWDTTQVGAVGECLARLLVHYEATNLTGEIKDRLVASSYALLSRCIELQPGTPFDSLHYRYAVGRRYERSFINLIGRYVPFGFIPHVLLAADAFDASAALAAVGYDEDARQELAVAKELHDYLEDISVNGRDADEYTLDQLAAIGRDRHAIISRAATQDYLAGRFDISPQELEGAFA